MSFKSLTDFQSSQQFMRCSSSLEVALRQQIHKNKSVSDLNDKSKSKLKWYLHEEITRNNSRSKFNLLTDIKILM